MGERLLHVPAARGKVFDLFHQDDVMEPGNRPERRARQLCRSLRHFCDVLQFCRSLRHFCGGVHFCRRLRQNWGPSQSCHRLCRNHGAVGILPIESDHPPDVPLGETLQVRQFIVQFAGEPGNDGRAPTFAPLAVVDDPPDVPVETDEFGVDRQHCPRLGALDAALHVGEEGREGRANHG